MNICSIKPPRIRIEACSACQLKCPSCTTGNGRLTHSVVGTGFLKKEQFANLIIQNPWISEVELSNWGEIFLNPDIKDIFRLAFDHNIRVEASNGVNLNTAKKEVLEALVIYRVHHLTCSIDGASQETYVQYRQGGDFENVITNIKTINKYKEKYSSEYPKLTWKYVIFGHNEHEIPKAQQMAKELNMGFSYAWSWDKQFSPVKNAERILEETGLLKESSNWSPDIRKMCMQMWIQPQINYDGKVLGCCANTWGDYGNAFETGLAKVLNNEKINYARKMLMGTAPPREDIPCTRCHHFRELREANLWIDRKEVYQVLFRQILRPIYRRLGLNRLRGLRKDLRA